jgi:primosomal protein N' (replication factor Y)
VSVLHSELSKGERHDQWWRIREAEARVVVGARSAVFAPVPDLGLVVVDEEHDAAYKQDESPRYHGRDVAVMRAQLEGCPVLLGSATPSVESHTNALKGKYVGISMPTRIGARRLPRVEVVDRRQMIKAGGDPILGPTLREALGIRLERGEQALLLLNRRGYATSLLCRECGQQAACPNCSVSLTLHRGGSRALCHYCGHDVRSPSTCAACRGPYLRLTGYGTEKVVEAVKAVLPDARVERLDRDRASRRGVLAQVLVRFEEGEIDILVGTQMIAKGLDLPLVTLVGVISADVSLGLPDYRTGERAFQVLAQVAGRAGRGLLGGRVIVQTYKPEHYAIQAAAEHDYTSFYLEEIRFRTQHLLPPFRRLARLIIADPVSQRAEREARRLAAELSAEIRQRSLSATELLGPVPPFFSRIDGRYRWQIIIRSPDPMRLLTDFDLPAPWVVDIDPVSTL